MNLCIIPLEHGSQFTKGEYGLTSCTVRGIVRVSHKQRLPLHREPLLINSLSVSLKGQRIARIWDSLTCSLSFKCAENFLDLEEYLLREPETIQYGKVVDLPFEILLPGPRDTGESREYLPPTFVVGGMSAVGYGHQYECAVRYTLSAKMAGEQVSSDGVSSGQVPLVSDPVEIPLVLYNPAHLMSLMWPEARRWRSLPGMNILDYDIELGYVAMGPGDPLRLVYNMRLTDHAVKKNIRIKKVLFMLRETHAIGECYTDCGSTTEHCKVRVKNTITLINFPLKASDFKSSKRRPHKRYADYPDGEGSSGLLFPSKGFSPGSENYWDNGISLFSRNILHVPARGKSTPCTGEKYLNLSNYKRRGVSPHIDISHTLQVTVEFSGAESITMRGSCNIFPVGRADYSPLFNTSPEVFPTPDYEKVVGCECWVPSYADTGETHYSTGIKLSSDAVTAVTAAYADQKNGG